MIGRIYHQFRSRFRHGIKTAYYRDVVRKRILAAKPVTKLDDNACEIHVLTSQQDWLNLAWALKSFYWASQRRYQLCIHDDGTLSEQASNELSRLFPEARLIGRRQADQEVLPYLENHPRCKAFRESNHLSPKLFDFRYYLQADRMLLLDSDVLFFSEPAELIYRIESPDYHKNSANKDVISAYTVSPENAFKLAHVRLPEGFNSGLGVLHAESIRLDWIEEFLGLPDILSHFWRIEQTLFALCSSRYGVDLLPLEYRIMLSKGLEGVVAKHYVGAVRHLMYSEGMAKLVKRGMLATS